MKSNHIKALSLTATGVLLLSFESLLIKLTSITAITYSFYLGLFIIISINLILIKSHKENFLKTYRSGFIYVLLCGAFFGSSSMTFVLAIKNTSVANTVMILSTAPLLSSFYAYLFYREKSSKNIYISTLFIFLGLMVIFSSSDEHSSMIGNIYAFVSANMFSLAFVFMSKHTNLNRYAVTSCSGVFILVTSYILSTSLLIDTYTFFILLIAGLLVSPLARVLMGTGAKTLPASEVSLLMIIETIMAPLWVWLFLHEEPSLTTFIGGGIILCTLVFNSIYLIKMHKKSQRTI